MIIDYEFNDYSINTVNFERILIESLNLMGISNREIELSVSFVSEENIRILNRDYRNIDKKTDVLSFPLLDIDEIRDSKHPILLGDVVICPEVAKKQALEIGNTFDLEVEYLFIHSIFHLLGFDHIDDDDRVIMREKEKAIVNKMKYIKLLEEAKGILENAYAPYSKLKVGASLLSSDGNIYSAVNVENSSFGATVCAERMALGQAISKGDHEFVAIAIYSSRGKILPCGICLQSLVEFGTDLDIVTGDEELEVYKLKDLLPKEFVL